MFFRFSINVKVRTLIFLERNSRYFIDIQLMLYANIFTQNTAIAISHIMLFPFTSSFYVCIPAFYIGVETKIKQMLLCQQFYFLPWMKNVKEILEKVAQLEWDPALSMVG